jgi:hypothetical protein
MDHLPLRALGLLVLGLGLGCGVQDETFGVALVPPANPLPNPGEQVVFQVQSQGGGTVRYQWLHNGVAIAGATAPTFVLGPVTLADGGSYQVQATDGGATRVTPAFDLEPADAAWTVTSAADSGPGTLRDILAQANGAQGVNGIQFDLGPAAPDGSYTIRLAAALPPVTGSVRVLGPYQHPLTLDAGGASRPFFVQGGTLVLDGFTVANGLAKGGDALGGGGAAAGMGGALFINGGGASLVRMTFQGNQALGGSSGPGGDGEAGGGGGFGGDSPAQGGNGAGGGLLGGAGGFGILDGTGQGGPAVGGSGGGGGGASRGGLLGEPEPSWIANLEGGEGDWGGGGGFAVGPLGGGGNARFGGGGGGSGGVAAIAGVEFRFPGGSSGLGGFCGGDGSTGDGAGRPGQGGGGGGLGGAVFLRAGTLALSQCVFQGNRAEPGNGAEPGLGKGGALFIYPLVNQAPMAATMFLAQTYSGNQAADPGVENPATDNNDYYIAQADLQALARTSPIGLRYQRYRQFRRRPGAPPGR